MLTTHLHLLPWWRMIGAIPLLPLYPFTVSTRTTLTLRFLQHTVRLGNQTARTEVDIFWLYYSVALVVVTRQIHRILKGNPLDNEPLHFSYWFSGWISGFMNGWRNVSIYWLMSFWSTQMYWLFKTVSTGIIKTKLHSHLI